VSPTAPTVSIIIPVLDEEAGIADTLAAAAVTGAGEILVVDGGSSDRTRAIAAARGCRVVDAPAGRAVQMNAGAAAATGDVLLFLHADTWLPPNGVAELTSALSDERTVGGRFDVRLDGPEPIFRVIETLMNVRSRVTRIATGDQAIFVRRAVFDVLGGYAPIPLMEDVEFSARLKRRGRLACLRSRVRTSARRWRRHGPWATIARMWWLRTRYALGTSPDRLAQHYARVR
jgi:rSAM/selenodomain-associated transferase 2